MLLLYCNLPYSVRQKQVFRARVNSGVKICVSLTRDTMSATGAWPVFGFRRRTSGGAGGDRRLKLASIQQHQRPYSHRFRRETKNVESSKKAVSLDLRRNHRERGGPGID